MAISVRDASVYTELNGLQAISQLGRENSPEALKQVAVQFESMFLNIMLKGMRAGEEALFSDNYLRSNEMSFHRENLDNQLALHMASTGGVGLADTLHRQLMQRYEKPVQPVNADLSNAAMLGDLGSARRFTGEVVSPGSDQETMVRWRARTISTPSIVPTVLDDLPVNRDVEQFESPEAFVAALLPAAQRHATELGVDARVLLAQSALETGWGQKMIRGSNGEASFNLFGIKAGDNWHGRRVNVSTLEFRDGAMHREVASFRAYDSYEESFADYVNLMKSQSRYAPALEHAADANIYTEKLQQAGYATDPDYAEKIQRVMRSPSLQQASLANNAQAWTAGNVQ
jgi:peptidoglycan hydrolase FlgJ